MSYTPKTWVYGETIEAEDMNHLEQGVKNATDGGTSGVTSFNGRTGAVSPESGDYTVEQVTGAAPTKSPVFTSSISMGRKAGTTIGLGSVAEGYGVEASGYASHAEGVFNTASGNDSHAEGVNTTASGYASHAGGEKTIAAGSSQTAIGRNNIESNLQTDILIVGNGGLNSRSNCLRVTATGVYASGNYNASGADYAEMFEWLDGNKDSEDRVGLFVTLDGKNIRIATPEDDFILGIVSGNPSVVGDVHDDQWQGMYLYDIFGRPLWEDVEIPEETDPNSGEIIIPAHTEHRQKLNPDYDGTKLYQARTKRPEWDAVGMLGKLVAVDDGTCQPNAWAMVGNGGIATRSAERTKYRVMERLDDTHIRVMVL